MRRGITQNPIWTLSVAVLYRQIEFVVEKSDWLKHSEEVEAA